MGISNHIAELVNLKDCHQDQGYIKKEVGVGVLRVILCQVEKNLKKKWEIREEKKAKKRI